MVERAAALHARSHAAQTKAVRVPRPASTSRGAVDGGGGAVVEVGAAVLAAPWLRTRGQLEHDAVSHPRVPRVGPGERGHWSMVSDVGVSKRSFCRTSGLSVSYDPVTAISMFRTA